MAFKTFTAGEVLTASDVNTYLAKQSRIVCTSGTRPGSPVEGMTIYETDLNRIMGYDGTAWQIEGFLPALVTVQKATATSRSSTIARTADPDLVVALPASSSWNFEAVIYHSSAANAAGDLAFEWTWPANATLSAGVHGLANALPSGSQADLEAGPTTRLDATSPSVAQVIGCSVGGGMLYATGRIVLGVTAGNLTFSWAQETSNGNNTTILEGSTLTATRVA